MSLGQEAVTIAGLEKSYLTNSRRKTIIALEELNFVWCDDEATEVAEMWRLGIPIDMIADNFARDPDEVAILLMHLARQGRIKARPSGVFGRCSVREEEREQTKSNMEQMKGDEVDE